jgi:type I restriction enzyme, S subunit
MTPAEAELDQRLAVPVAADADLPEGWVRATLPDIAGINMGQSPPGSTYNRQGEGLPFFQGKADFGALHPTVRVWCMQPTKIAEPGDLLISVRAPVGPTNIANQRCAFGRGLAAISPAGSIPTMFLLYALRQQEAQLAEQGAGSTFEAINRTHLDAVEIAVPPLAEQQRIVAQVEALLARTTATRERLAKVPAVLKRFRQAVLAAACDGRLTVEWRRARASLWRNSSPERWHNCQESDDLQYIPTDWQWSSVGELCVAIVDCPHSTPKWTSSGRVCLRTTNFRPGYLDLTSVRYVSESTYRERIKRLEPLPGDVLYSREGGILGVACIVPPGLSLCLGQRMMLMRPDVAVIQGSYLMHVLNAPQTLDRVVNLTGGSASPHLNVGDIKAFPVPLPSVAEQHEIVLRVEALFALADKIERRVAAATLRSEKLTQAVLARAFRGELVPTEAELARREGREYEPATVLLERIRRERVSSRSPKGRRRGARPRQLPLLGR